MSGYPRICPVNTQFFAGHCPLTGRYLQPCVLLTMVFLTQIRAIFVSLGNLTLFDGRNATFLSVFVVAFTKSARKTNWARAWVLSIVMLPTLVKHPTNNMSGCNTPKSSIMLLFYFHKCLQQPALALLHIT